MTAGRSEKGYGTKMLKIDIWNIAFTVINVLVLYVLMRKFLFKPIIGILEKREALIKESMENAENSKTQAEEMLKAADEKLKGADDEARALAEQRLNDANEKCEKLIADAQSEARDIIENGRKRAALERDKMIKDAKSDIVDIAMDAVEKLADCNVNEKQAGELFDELLEKAGNGK